VVSVEVVVSEGSQELVRGDPGRPVVRQTRTSAGRRDVKVVVLTVGVMGGLLAQCK
jgi:hypothetical protein